METGTIVAWNLAEGESFGAGDIIAEIQTDKATVDFEAQDDAFLAKILVSDPTREIPVGEPIAIFVEDEDDIAAFKDYKAAAAIEEVQPEPEPTVVAAPPAVVVSEPAVSTVTTTAQLSDDGRVVASPLAHKLAKEMGIAIGSVPGTGPNGRIIADDVREFVPPVVVAAPETVGTNLATEAVSVAPMGGNFADYVLSADQAQMAAALTAQKQHVPHYYLTVDLDLEPILNLRKSSKMFGNVSVNAMLLKASICALKDCPVVNSRWMDSFVRMYSEVALEYVLPEQSIVINSAAGKGISEIDSIITENSNDESQASVGTFSVVNLGMYGVKAAAPIIRPGQSAILALGAAENRLVPSASEDELYTTAVMATATLSCDHRVVDGAVGAQWLAAFKGYVEDPMSMLL